MSEEIIFVAQLRKETGKTANRILRRNHLFPASMNGLLGTQMIALQENIARKTIEDMIGIHQLVTLKIQDQSGTELSKHRVLLQEIQQHPYRDQIIHIDFRELDPNQPVDLKIPLRAVGVSPGVKLGGTLQMVVREVPITCKPDAIPEYIEMDISNLQINSQMRIEELRYPENVTPRNHQNYTLAVVKGRVKASTEDTADVV